ncbi:transmembrane amino acid transporter protein-domain-containing protein [Lipomyces kononenkoae]|uniref:Transmembrane amino acid transporter protein-domain-containing protein n=1 Tax=Lipomyces kononenkoae TaxID=34357 RepID=A0ACC3T2Y5_LIPKO
MATESTIFIPHGRSPNSNVAAVEYVENDEDADFNINHISDNEYEDDATANHGKFHVGSAGIASSVANLSNTILGAGILAMPYALKNDGVFLGFLVILVSGFTAGAGLFLQYRCSRYLDRGTASFFAIAQKTYPSLAAVFDTAIAIKCFGVGVSYLIIIGDLMPQVIVDFFFADGTLVDTIFVSRRFWISFFMVVLVPLCFLRRLDSLKYTSVVALLAIGYLVVLVIGHWLVGDTVPYRGTISVGPYSLSGVLSTLPIVVFGFTCHQNMFSIVNELKDDRPENALLIVFSSIGSAIVLYTLVGFTGYLSFGDNVGGNIISMYASSFSSAVGRAAIVVLVLFSYPLQCHPCRASLDHIYTHFILPSSGGGGGGDVSRLGLHKMSIPKRRFVVLTSVVIVLSYIVAITVSSLETVLAFVGATGSTSISFILPGIFGYKLLGSPYHLPIPDVKDDDETLESGDVVGSRQAVRLVTPEEQRGDDDDDDYESNVGREMVRDLDGEGAVIKYASLALAGWGIFIMVVCLGTNIWLLRQPKD